MFATTIFSHKSARLSNWIIFLGVPEGLLTNQYRGHCTVDGRNPQYLGCQKPSWDKLPINWRRISSSNSITNPNNAPFFCGEFPEKTPDIKASFHSLKTGVLKNDPCTSKVISPASCFRERIILDRFCFKVSSVSTESSGSNQRVLTANWVYRLSFENCIP